MKKPLKKACLLVATADKLFPKSNYKFLSESETRQPQRKSGIGFCVLQVYNNLDISASINHRPSDDLLATVFNQAGGL